MLSKLHFIKGFIKNIFNPRIALLSFVSSNNLIDSKACIYRMCKIKHSTIGAYSYIGNNTDVENAIIGKFSSIADNCRIGMGNHTLDLLSTNPIFTQMINGTQSQWIYKDFYKVKNKETIIGNDVWVGSHVLIRGGVKIGDGAVIGAGAVVVKDIPPFAVVGGVPAKLIKYRFSQEIIDKIEEIKWWNLQDYVLKDKIHLFQKENLTVQDLECFFK